jgi:hypothetical protein
MSAIPPNPAPACKSHWRRDMDVWLVAVIGVLGRSWICKNSAVLSEFLRIQLRFEIAGIIQQT